MTRRQPGCALKDGAWEHSISPRYGHWCPLSFWLDCRRHAGWYPGVLDVLNDLRPRYRLAAISDAQSAWCLPEMRAVGLDGYFDPIIVSGDFGYRKPDPRLFTAALTALRVAPENALFVGNDMFRDVYAAKRLGIKTVFFSSNQGGKQAEGVTPDYIIYQFPELRQAVEFFERQ